MSSAIGPDIALRKNKKGFTLIEAFLAIAILAICAVGIFASFYAGLAAIGDIRENIIASAILQEKMEELRKEFFPSAGTITFSSSSYGSFSESDFPLISASGARKVQQYSSIDTGELVRVVVEITWNSRVNTSKQNRKALVSIISRNGINAIE